MIRGDLLIDGYNLLHAAGLARRSYGPGEFERQRRRLLSLLASQLFEQERLRTTVVFDAPEQSLGPSPPSIVHGIRVVFADGNGDADAALECLIRQNSAPRRLHVVSSDHRLQRAARRRRAKYYDSHAFLARLTLRPTPEERAERSEPPQKRDGLTAAAEIAAWLKAFSGIDPDRTQDVSIRRCDAEAAVPEDDPLAEAAASPLRPSAKQPRFVAADELAFWEQRVADLWEEQDRDERQSPGDA